MTVKLKDLVSLLVTSSYVIHISGERWDLSSFDLKEIKSKYGDCIVTDIDLDSDSIYICAKRVEE